MFSIRKIHFEKIKLFMKKYKSYLFKQNDTVANLYPQQKEPSPNNAKRGNFKKIESVRTNSKVKYWQLLHFQQNIHPF